jgi:hypothetical protein
VAVVLTPGALFGLRLFDDSALALVLEPLLVVLAVLFLVIVAAAARRSARQSPLRAFAGAGGALVLVALLVWPMTHVFGQRSCPDRMGPDRGLQVSMRMLDAWQSGKTPPVDIWTSPVVADAWQKRARTITLVDYKLTDSGCWERLAPVTTSQTWHQFRATVRQGVGDGFSKTVTVHTSAAWDGWTISEVEGPEL